MTTLSTTIRVSEMRSLITKYTSNFPSHHIPSSKTISTTWSYDLVLNTVLLVGSRGGIGANILTRLLQATQVRRVYVLNRARIDKKTAQERQADEFAVQGLDASLANSEKLVLLEGDTAHPNLELSESVFDEVSMPTYLRAYGRYAGH